jgi:hypothetical protein
VRLPPLPIEDLLAGPVPSPRPGSGHVLGLSREGRPVLGHRLGRGPLRVSLIAGNHADEPVGPELLERLARHLAALQGSDPDHPLLTGATWTLVPHTNPDGRADNALWADSPLVLRDPRGGPDRRFYDLVLYQENAVRALPGDDMEFGFPRGPGDGGARPENRAVAAFLAEGAREHGPYHLHATLHGMGFARGPWFLIEPAWVERTAELRRRLAARVHAMGYELHDVDRGGEKGFTRIGEGFSTRPDSRAMIAYFRERDDEATAALFRPSSMEYVRSLGGDPLTLVSEMPLFLMEDRPGGPAPPMGHTGREAFTLWLHRLVRGGADGESDARRRELIAERAAAHGVRAMPIEDQMRLQAAFLDEGLRAVGSRAADG